MATPNTILSVLILAVAIPGFSSAVVAGQNPCELLDPESEDVKERTFGTFPYINGEIEFDSRRQRSGSRMAYYWSIPSNTTGFTAQIHWGTEGAPKKHFSGKVKNDIKSPRCKSASSNRAAKIEDRVFKYRRPLYGWEKGTPETVIRTSATILPPITEFVEDVLNAVVGKAHAQGTDDLVRMVAEYNGGALAPEIEAYFDPEFGLNVDAMISDPNALRAYAEGGYGQPLTQWTFTVLDIPNSTAAVGKLLLEQELRSDELSPAFFGVTTVVTPTGDEDFLVDYVVRSRLLFIEGEDSGYVEREFSDIGYASILKTDNDQLAEIFEGAEGFLIEPTLEKENIGTVSTLTGRSFSAESSGTLLVTNDDGVELSIFEFSVLTPIQN